MLVLYNHPKFSFSQPEPEEGRGRRPVLGLPPRFAEFVGCGEGAKDFSFFPR